MKKKNFFFKSSFIQSNEFYKNLNKTKKVFKTLLLDIFKKNTSSAFPKI